MTKYPFSFAVFFQCIIKHCSSYNKNLSAHALFYGQIIDPNTFVHKISAGTISEYIRAKRPVKAEIVDKICKYSIEDLRSHIQILNIQDTAQAIEAIKRMLNIVRISDKFKQELLDEADRVVDRTLFIAKIYRESMKSYMQLNLTSAQINYLDSIWTTVDLGNSIDYDVEDRIQFSSESDIDDIRDNDEDNETNKKSEDPFDYIEALVDEALRERERDLFFSKGTVKYGYVKLPEDFDNLIRFMAPLIGNQGVVNLDFADIVTVTGLDYTTKRNNGEKLYVADISGNLDFCLSELKRLPHSELFNSALINIIVGPDIGLMEATELTNALQENCPDMNILFGLNMVEDWEADRIQVQLVLSYQKAEKNTEEPEKETKEGRRESVLDESKIDISYEEFDDIFEKVFGSGYEGKKISNANTNDNKKKTIQVPNFVMHNNKVRRQENAFDEEEE